MTAIFSSVPGRASVGSAGGFEAAQVLPGPRRAYFEVEA
jgi:hypothetical protein